MYLCIDTISSAAGISIASQDAANYLPLDPKNSSEGIIDAIDKALEAAGITLSDLKGILVIKGPGSFTGLRVGLTVANQFAHQLKLPIIGFTTDEWWLARSSEDATYLQSMNKEEVYIADQNGSSIKELKTVNPCQWLGQLTDDHRAKLSQDFEEIKTLTPIDETWKKLLPKEEMTRGTYDLVEPFYGKEPNITKSKRQVQLSA